MESDDDIELLPSSSVQERKLKRLKKAVRVPEYPRPNTPDNGPSTPLVNSSESDSLHSYSPNGHGFEEFNVGSGPTTFDSVGDENGLSTELDALESVKKDGPGAMRVLEFDSAAEEFGGNGEACSMEVEKGEEVRDLKTEELEKKRHSLDSFEEKRDRKKKRVDGDRDEKKVKGSTSSKRRAEKVCIWVC